MSAAVATRTREDRWLEAPTSKPVRECKEPVSPEQQLDYWTDALEQALRRQEFISALIAWRAIRHWCSKVKP